MLLMVFTRQMWIVNIIIEDEEAFTSHPYTHTYCRLWLIWCILCSHYVKKKRERWDWSDSCQMHILKNQVIIPGHISESNLKIPYQMVHKSNGTLLFTIFCRGISLSSWRYLIFTAITSVTLGLHQRCSCLNIYSNQPN